MQNEALSLAKKLCSTMMEKFQPEDLPPKGSWHYHQGVFLLGMYKIYEITKDVKYYNYIKAYVDSKINHANRISYNCTFDDAMPSILLFPLYKENNDVKYKVTLDECAMWIPKYFKTPSGGFWHKFTTSNQMWLDGFYMAQPLCVKYASEFGGHDEFYEMAYTQLKLMKKSTRDEKTGLWYHAYDESRKAPWCDKETGKSPEFWGRAFGWIGCALVDIIEYMPESCNYKDYFIETLKEYVEAVISVQDKNSGIWYQVLDKGYDSQNWLETSCSCLFTYTILKGIRMGYVDNKYLKNAYAAFEGIKKQLTFEDDKVLINNICIGTPVGDYQHYINRPRTVNDLHGAGAFLLAMSEICKLETIMQGGNLSEKSESCQNYV